MSVIVSRSTHPMHRPASPAPPTPPYAAPTVRITVDVPLDRIPLPPQAIRLLELIRELAQPGGAGPFSADAFSADAFSADAFSADAFSADPFGTDPAGSPSATVLRHPAADARAWTANQLRVLVGPRLVLLGNEPVPLTRLEFELLRFLAAHPRQVFSRRQLLRSVWRDDLGVSRTVDVHVRRLRAKFGPDVPVVTTVYGVGYRLADNERIILQGER